MTQKKKTNKKPHKKKHLNQNKQNIIYQSIPNYSSGQFSGHQNNKNNIQYAPAAQQESRTDNIVGDLVSKLIGKIENDGSQQTQQYSKEIQPINNNNNGNNSVVNIYNDGTKKEDKKPDETPEAKAETIINNYGRSAAEDFGIQTAAGAAGLIGVGGLGVAYNSDVSSKAKLKLKKVGGGILGAVTSVGAAINNNILKRGTKLGGDKTTTNLIKEEGKMYEKKGKAGKFARLEDEMNPLQADFDKHINQPSTKITDLDAYMKKKHGHLLKPEVEDTTNSIKKISQIETPTPTPTKGLKDTPIRRINLFSPASDVANFKPQNMFSPPINLLTTPKPMYTQPVETTLKKMNAGDKLKAYIKRNSVQKDLKEVNQEASKIQRGFRNTKTMKLINTKAFSAKRNAIEVSQRPMPARLSGVHETTRQGATNTRIHKQNQAIGQLRQQPPTRQSSVTEISNAVTTSPQAEKRPVGRPKGSGTPKPMRIKYDKPGRPKSMPDPEGLVSEPKTPKLRFPKKK